MVCVKAAGRNSEHFTFAKQKKIVSGTLANRSGVGDVFHIFSMYNAILVRIFNITSGEIFKKPHALSQRYVRY
jgi:hypothetical protein